MKSSFPFDRNSSSPPFSLIIMIAIGKSLISFFALKSNEISNGHFLLLENSKANHFEIFF